MSNPLFTGTLVRLAALDPETVSQAFERWSRDSELRRLENADPVYPDLAARVREEMENPGANSMGYAFNIHVLADDRLIGVVDVSVTRWHHGDAFVGIGIGDRADWGKGYGTDAMCVLLRYAFTELNLHRVSLTVFEYNPRAIRSYEKAGFRHEGRLRQWLHREGRRWDLLYMGILREEWQEGVNLAHRE